MKRMCTIFCDMYAAGDMDTRAVIQFGVLNNIKNEAAINNIIANLRTAATCRRCISTPENSSARTSSPKRKRRRDKKVEATPEQLKNRIKSQNSS